MKILLVHGLGRTPMSMMGLSYCLDQSGYQTEFFSYTAFAESYEQIVTRLRDRFRLLSTHGPYGVVAHSLGGILTRSALALSRNLPRHIVMLGTPNQPPRLAKLAWNLWPFQWFSGTSGANLASSEFYASLPDLHASYTIIAGTSGPRGPWSPFGMELNDGLVALNETRLLESDQPLTFPGIHGFMMNQATVQTAVARVLQQTSSR
ncbi:alpha/beta fold hydrolase (plasmid) [Acaryochloris sp. 'Moss Beach']|nr:MULTISPECIES: alpha/beta hydrolase [Acaryochloris]QUY46035.1 alpha/beta fold hydrolase [Acaryochloris marina S15]UJB72630.1 alpha/beta fold hydrolase [Acaryochloris sp. 'Moss Beach']